MLSNIVAARCHWCLATGMLFAGLELVYMLNIVLIVFKVSLLAINHLLMLLKASVPLARSSASDFAITNVSESSEKVLILY